MLVHNAPSVMLYSTFLLELGEEVSLLLCLVEESELLIDERMHTNASNTFCLHAHVLYNYILLRFTSVFLSPYIIIDSLRTGSQSTP